MQIVKNKSWLVRNAAWLQRRLKYGVAAPMMGWLVRYTPLLDGQGEPPRAINYSAAGDYVPQGDEIINRLHDDFDLTDGCRVLDIGCGIGRLATAFHRKGSRIRYDGFDIVKYGVEWCTKTIPPAEGYTFKHADVHNPFYNPWGKIAARTYRFPYPENSFDLAIAVSVFTHLLEPETRAYFEQAMRVLDVGGKTYFTTFLIPEHIPDNRNFSFRHQIDEAYVERLEEPEMAVGYTLAFWQAMAEANNARLVQINRGSWTGAAGLPDYQDCLIFEKLA
ncbi:class I SAM-dependent methyltransferase [Tateyamaria omphalii]|uniref:class I SAM-dependent methyltransferase n=1 Tax=Tateyamaria omphalii TaxID=299262 RepID=UPI001C98F6E8|nr:class I SAM-dependent methyltransferase [Tateyamaria omphalii]MBY5931582.1 class I SAM-dependent methyltransferase [Tateyamaria omphalii]